jgi:hypothetical protein
MKEGVNFTPATADYKALRTDIDAKTDFVKVCGEDDPVLLVEPMLLLIQAIGPSRVHTLRAVWRCFSQASLEVPRSAVNETCLTAAQRMQFLYEGDLISANHLPRSLVT